ncbi:MAG TPA: DUF5317 domain-containing protein [Thermoanaerobacterales bacterium]|mgnify:CR=1 FL=1|jgi:hypothetical protein|nr:DUF5317 domain-containing protein [Thermoanaerobacterales bacterium]
MLVDFLIISLLVGLFRGGKLKDLVEIPIKNIEFIFMSFAIRYLPLILKGSLLNLAIRFNWLVVTVPYMLLLYALITNFHIRAMGLVALGVFMNYIVIFANGWKMPVSLWALELTRLEGLKELLFDPNYLYHTAVDSTTKLKFLADVIPMPPPYPKPRVFSIGDLTMSLGLFFLIQKYMKPVIAKKIHTTD